MSFIFQHTCSPVQPGTFELPATQQTTSNYPGDDGMLKKGTPLPAIRIPDYDKGAANSNFTGLI
ncbi:MAG: hypothetical protein V1775_16750 [Bacteroidota bacterium]